MSEKCNHCDEEIEPPEYEEMEYHKQGRIWRCTSCGKRILFQQPAGNMEPGKTPGTLKRKYKPRKK